MPASPETVAAWMSPLANGEDGAAPRARGTINQYLSAIIVAHRTKRHVLDRKDPLITETWRGISNTKAGTEIDRAARPLVVEDLRALLRGLRLDIPTDARDAALPSRGWAGALRRSELVGLDW
jgi:site-specific recombinase XerC